MNRIDMDLVLKQHAAAQQQQQQRRHLQQSVAVGSKGLPKSSSVGMAKIDEDEASEFADGGVDVVPDLYPRSRSYAVGKRNVVY